MLIIIKYISAITKRLAAGKHPCYCARMKEGCASYDGEFIEWEQRSVRSARVTFGQVRYSPGGFCGPRTQRDYQLVLLYAGSCDVKVDAANIALRVGEARLFTPGHREHFQFDARVQSHHFWCSASPAALPRELRLALDAAACAAAPPSECFARLASAAFLLLPDASDAAGRAVDALAAALFSEFLNMAAHAAAAPQRDACVARALRHMQGHLSEPGCLAGAQRAAGCCANALIYKFKAAMGATPARHLWRLRAEKGLELLADTGLSVAEIAEQCGFRNPFHFSRCIRGLQGASPREVRRRAWDKAGARR
jgi:AraC-like DNA-binding protein